MACPCYNNVCFISQSVCKHTVCAGPMWKKNSHFPYLVCGRTRRGFLDAKTEKKRISLFHIQKVTKFKRYIFLANTTEYLDIMDIMTSSPVKPPPPPTFQSYYYLLINCDSKWGTNQVPLLSTLCTNHVRAVSVRSWDWNMRLSWLALQSTRFNLKGNYSMGSLHGELL